LQQAFTTTGTHVLYEMITQCYLPPGTGNMPVFTLAN